MTSALFQVLGGSNKLWPASQQSLIQLQQDFLAVYELLTRPRWTQMILLIPLISLQYMRKIW